MSLVNAGVALSQLRGFRMCWYPGRFSSGKSAIAFRMAYELSQNWGYRIVSNQECVWNETVPPDWIFDDRGNMTLQCIAIVDEGGLWVQDEVEAMEYLAFAGKMDLIVSLPSITEPCDLFASLSIQPMYNFRSVGVPINVYQWRVSQQKAKFQGGFQWWGMEEIYGTYSTLNPSADPRGLLYYLRQKVLEYKKYYFERQKIPSWQEEYAVRALAEQELRGRKKGKNAGAEVVTDDAHVVRDGSVLEAAKKFERVSNDLETLFEREAKRNRNRRGWFG
jgi:hypothetical protein